MIELDGAAGGGQLVRTALSLSALSGEPFRMEGVRGTRSPSGLGPQHVAAVEALAAITDADVSGGSEGSETLVFEPGPLSPGRYAVDVGTAGSVALLFDTVLPLAVALEGPLSLDARGGTDVKWAPTFDFLRLVKLPLLRRHGVGVAVDLLRRGFYPTGGGQATLSVFPSSPTPLDLEPVEEPGTVRVSSVASADLADREVAERQAAAAVESLAERGVPVVRRTVEYADVHSTGTAITVVLLSGSTRLGGDALGERGTPAEDVGAAAVERALEAVDAGAAVDVHFGDQLLIFLALVGGRVVIPRVTDHVESAISLLGRFGFDVRLDRGDPPTVSLPG